MSLRFLIVIILVFTFSKANAGYIKGLGANQCGKVISTVEEGEKQNIEWVNMMYTAWIQGYLSGLDDDKPNNNSRLKGVHKDSLFYAVLNRCKAEPLKDLYEATEYVYYNKL